MHKQLNAALINRQPQRITFLGKNTIGEGISEKTA
jgi:hypothetical protein